MNICGLDVVVDYTYTVTANGCAAHMGGPSYAGHPSEPMEYEVEVEGLREDTPEGVTHKLLYLPDWLASQIETELLNSDRVYDDICAAEREGP
jgi:hypothetical protein